MAADVPERIGTWLRLIPKRMSPTHIQLAAGDVLIGEVSMEDTTTTAAADLLAEAAINTATNTGKTLILTLRAVNEGGRAVAATMLRIRPVMDDEGGPPMAGTAPELLKMMAAHVHAIMVTHTNASQAMLKAATDLMSAMSTRTLAESERANAAEKTARDALDVADQALAKAAKAAEEKPIMPAMEKAALVMVGQKMGLDPNLIVALMNGGQLPTALPAAARAAASPTPAEAPSEPVK